MLFRSSVKSYSKVINVNNVNGNLSTLKEINLKKIKTPAQRDAAFVPQIFEDGTLSEIGDSMYEVNGEPFYRATAYLGFGVDESSMFLVNAQAIGNVTDELSKRIFSDEYSTAELEYSKVTQFVKDEKFNQDRMTQATDKALFYRTYKEPVSKASFEALRDEMQVLKDRKSVV